MDPNYIDEEGEAAAMAAMMGFSGFGSQKPPAKRRKFTTDAFVEGQDVAALDKGGKKGQGSGGNTMPLGKQRVFGTLSSNKATEPIGVNDAEFDLGDENEADGPQYVDTSLPPPVLAGDEGGLHYVDISEPPPTAGSYEEAKEMQLKIDAILASVESRESIQPPASGTKQPHDLPQRSNFKSPNTTGDSQFMRGGSRPNVGSGKSRNIVSDSASITSSKPSQRGGPNNENWYLEYYDPSFNENPWEKLEKEKGLEPLGSWGKVQGDNKLA